MSMLDSFMIMFDTDSKKASRDVDDLNKKLDGTEDAANDATEGLDNTTKAADELGIQFSSTAKQAGLMIASFFAIGSVIDTAMNVAQATDEMGKFADVTGMSIVKLDAWGEAAARNGGSAEAFRSSVMGIADQLQGIQFGGGTEIVRTLGMIGVSAFNSNGQIKDTLDILRSVGGVFEGMSKQRSLTLGKRLGLDQGTILLLQQGRYNLDQLVEQQEAFGSSSKEAYIAAADFDDAVDNLDRTFNSVWQSANTTILPLFTAMIDGFRDVINWMRENETFMTGFFAVIGGAITALLVGPLATAAAFAAPFVAMGAAIAGVAVAFALMYEDVKAYINGQESLIGKLGEKYEWFGDLVDGIIDGVKFAWKGISDAFDWSYLLVTKPSEALDILKQQFVNLWDFIKNLFDFGFIGDFFGFGDDSDKGLSQQTKAALATTSAYNANPLNSYQMNLGGAGGNVYNANTFSMSNNINAKGVTPDQVKQTMNQELLIQLAMALGMIDDGVSH